SLDFLFFLMSTSSYCPFSLHDALPISVIAGAMGLASILYNRHAVSRGHCHDGVHIGHLPIEVDGHDGPGAGRDRLFQLHRVNGRSEEHTSELQSRENSVCRLLLEKKIV